MTRTLASRHPMDSNFRQLLIPNSGAHITRQSLLCTEPSYLNFGSIHIGWSFGLPGPCTLPLDLNFESIHIGLSFALPEPCTLPFDLNFESIHTGQSSAHTRT
jgi:hypothetical protein